VNEQNYTPEPWAAFVGKVGGQEVCIIGPENSPLMTNQRVVCVVTDLATMNEEDQANASRIVACVNACANIPNEALLTDGFTGAVENIVRRDAELRDENRRLTIAIGLISERQRRPGGSSADDAAYCFRIANEARNV
jgi:hypothetical protein